MLLFLLLTGCTKMHLLFVLLYMREEKGKSFEYKVSVVPPRGLFSRVIKRLGLERELALVKGNLIFFSTLLVIFLVLSAFAFIGVKYVLATSSFGPFISLIFSDPSMVIKYWDNYVFAASESMPGIAIAGLIFSLAFLLLFVRFAVFAIDKTVILIKSINKSRYVK